MTRALVIVDHGSRREEAHLQLETLAHRVRERAPELRVYLAHLELVEPTLEQALARCAAAGCNEVAVHPLFLAPGRHLIEDLPARVELAAASHPGLRVCVTQPLGAREELADLVLASLDEQSN